MDLDVLGLFVIPDPSAHDWADERRAAAVERLSRTDARPGCQQGEHSKTDAQVSHGFLLFFEVSLRYDYTP
jgi:hypothetical protein